MTKTVVTSQLKSLLAIGILCLVFVLPAASAPHVSGLPEPLTSKVGTLLPQRTPSPSLLSAPALHARAANLNILLLRVDFPPDDEPTTTGSGEWNDPGYAYENNSDYWIDKNRTDLINYYSEVSQGRFNLAIDISQAIYRLPHSMTYYSNETTAAIENLIVDSISAAGAIDLSAYDTIAIVHAGAGEETDIGFNSTGDIWSLHYEDSMISRDDNDAYPAVVMTDGTPISGAILLPQHGMQDNSIVDTLGIFAHEFGHLLGMPDLYPTDTQSWAGAGEWCLMGAGLYNRADSRKPIGSSPAWPSAWCRLYLGWEDLPQEQTVPDPDLGLMTFAALTTPANPAHIRLLKIPISPGATTDYFLIENRQQTGFDAGLNGQGLLVWKIDSVVIDENIVLNTVNNDPLHPGVALLEADGDAALMSWYGIANPGDPFPGRNNISILTPTSVPASSTTTVGPGWLNMKSIRENDDGSITCSVGLGPPAVEMIAADFSLGTLELDWNAIPSSIGYLVYRNGTLVGSTTDSSFVYHNALETDKFAIASIDAGGNETLTLQINFAKEGSSSSGGCFIATAAYGSYEAPAVQLLRKFRDRILLPTAIGKTIVAAYYKISPPLAESIAASPLRKGIARILLLPLIGAAAVSIQLSELQPCTLIMTALFLFLTAWRLRLTMPSRVKTP